MISGQIVLWHRHFWSQFLNPKDMDHTNCPGLGYVYEWDGQLSK